MPLRTHLLIISVIITVLYVITQVFMATEKQPVVVSSEQSAPISAYNLTISSASWGLNCKALYTNRINSKNSANNNFDEESDEREKIKDNNVLYIVSQLCNGKPKCEIPIDPSVLGEDPFPSCGYKELQVEYRCFSVDKLRRMKATDGILTIDCDKQVKL